MDSIKISKIDLNALFDTKIEHLNNIIQNMYQKIETLMKEKDAIINEKECEIVYLKNQIKTLKGEK